MMNNHLLSVESSIEEHVINDIATNRTYEPRRCCMMASCFGVRQDMPQRLDHRPFDLHPDSIKGVSREDPTA
jgi:hypothetical protein